MERDLLAASDAKQRKAILVFQPPELALDGGASPGRDPTASTRGAQADEDGRPLGGGEVLRARCADTLAVSHSVLASVPLLAAAISRF